MRIEVKFKNGSQYWQDKVTAAAAKAAAILSTPEFLARIAHYPSFYFTELSSEVISKQLETTDVVQIVVGFYSQRWFTKAIAAEDENGVEFNTAKEAYGAGDWGNVMHETLHVLGFSHNGNAAAGNENSVPYRIPSLAQAWLDDGGKILLPEVATAAV